jgi:hypothetical protein
MREQLLCHIAKEIKELTSKPLDELDGAMLDEAVTTFEKARAKMNSAIRPCRDSLRVHNGFLTLPICINPHTLKPAFASVARDARFVMGLRAAGTLPAR